MANVKIGDFVQYLRDDPTQLDFESGRLVYRPTGDSWRLETKPVFRIFSNRRSRTRAPEPIVVFEALFRVWYDEYWRPAKIDEAIEQYRAPDSAVEHFLRKIGWRRSLRIPPTADAVLGVPIRNEAGSPSPASPEVMGRDPGSARPPVPHDKPQAAQGPTASGTAHAG
ncbi:MAG TPA: hypothetical protein DDZ81_25990 [Acetobacteraceae bacterium]|jgi:hypothetical protein|nr:hypothetical protein [Acetobacteraceae bacterium]